jgi:hypothetical protein
MNELGSLIDKLRPSGAELVERYVSAVKRRLAPKQAEDIAAELREAVLAKVEAEEERLGRAATTDEAAAILKSFGSPMLAAARFGGRQHLIGPDLYPYFWPTQRIVVGIVAAVAIVGFLARGVLTDHPMRLVMQGLNAAWNGAIFAFGVVALIFIVLEQTDAGRKIEASWRPEHLPRDTHGKPKSLFESLVSLACDAIFIAWWTGLFHLPLAISGRRWEDGVSFDFGPAWVPIHTLVLVMAVGMVAVHAADVVRPTWSRLRSVAVGAISCIGLYCVWLLGRSGELFMIRIAPGSEGAAAARIDELTGAFGTVSTVLIYVGAIGFGISLVIEIWRIVRSFRISASGPDGLSRPAK